MSISRFNGEGYYDPTAYEALSNVENKQMLDYSKRKVYVCSPYKGDVDINVANAKRYCRFVLSRGGLPIAVHLLFPQFMDDNSPSERKKAIDMGLELISVCNEFWIFGSILSAGMETELKAALSLRVKVRFFKDNCEEVIQDAKQFQRT